MTPAGEVVLAHATLLSALPFVGPAVLVVALIAAIVYRDRRAERREDEQV